MTDLPTGVATMSAISPFFIVRDLERALDFYRHALGFEATYVSPEKDPFFAIVRRDGVQLMLKVVGDAGEQPVEGLPNRQRHAQARWDAFVYAADPDALAAEFADREGVLKTPQADDDGLRGFEVEDRDGYVLFFGRPH